MGFLQSELGLVGLHFGFGWCLQFISSVAYFLIKFGKTFRCSIVAAHRKQRTTASSEQCASRDENLCPKKSRLLWRCWASSTTHALTPKLCRCPSTGQKSVVRVLRVYKAFQIMLFVCLHVVSWVQAPEKAQSWWSVEWSVSFHWQVAAGKKCRRYWAVWGQAKCFSLRFLWNECLNSRSLYTGLLKNFLCWLKFLLEPLQLQSQDVLF